MTNNPINSDKCAMDLDKAKFSFDVSDYLKKTGIISDDGYRIACIEQENSGLPLEKIYVKLGFISEDLLREIISNSLNFVSFCKTTAPRDPRLVKDWPLENAHFYQTIPLAFTNGVLDVIMVDTFNLQAIDALKMAFKGVESIVRHVALQNEYNSLLNELYQKPSLLEKVHTHLNSVARTAPNETGSNFAENFVHDLLFYAIENEASDVHFECDSFFVRTRLRIDGLMQPFLSFHKKYWSSIVVRIKVLAHLNIAETRRPQNGRISLSILGRSIDLRISVHPTLFGEDIVIRILDKKHTFRKVEELGFTDPQLSLLKQLSRKPDGIILVTGPTGSGKTTTLYGMLNHLNVSSLKMMTLEQPIEYTVSQLRQTAIEEDHGITFGEGIRSILRQDPDVIMIGEIRDEETAQMAMRASLTGHLVFSSLHTKDWFGTLFRLRDLGMGLDLLAGNLLAVISQRLVRKLCDHCKKVVKHTTYEAQGCVACNFKGYKGRTVIAEIVPMTPTLEAALFEGHITRQGLQACMDNHFTMQDHATTLVEKGITSIDEARRVINFKDQPYA